MQNAPPQPVVCQFVQAKLQDLVGEHTRLTAALDGLDSHMNTMEERTNALPTAMSFSSNVALILVSDMDWFQGKMAECLTILDSVSSELNSREAQRQNEQRMEDGASYMPQLQESSVQQSGSSSGFRSSAESSLASFTMLKNMIDGIQQQVDNIQSSNLDSRLLAVEDKVDEFERLGSRVDGAERKLDKTADKKMLRAVESKLGKLEAKINKHKCSKERLEVGFTKLGLLEEMQLRNDECWNEASQRLFKLEHEMISAQDDMSKLESQQDDVGERLNDVKKSTDALVKLRDILNRLHSNVTSRGQYSQRLFQLEEEMGKIQVIVGTSGLAQMLQGEPVQTTEKNEVMPAFAALCHNCKAMPRGKISFSKTAVNEWACYDTATSMFEAPVEGVYYFTVSINTNSRGSFKAAISHNGNQAALMGTSGTKDEQTGTSVLLKLDAGDKIWVEADVETDPDGIDIDSTSSNFVGFRLR